MSQYKLEKVLRKELASLNEIIDQKIINGLSYAKEARRHRFIISRLTRVRRTDSRVGWPTRAISTFFSI